jgi:mono/diheme cytochrome c family protein
MCALAAGGPVTEIPEHLLKRSKQRRSAIGGGEGGDESTDAPAAKAEGSADAPAAVAKAPATPAPKAVEPAPKPPAPLPPYIEAAKRRHKIPVWAMPVLALLPVWAIIYANSMQEPPLGENDPMARGEALYDSHCSSCHDSTGGGGVGPALNNGAVLQTWPEAKDHIDWVNVGSNGWAGDTYGAQNKEKKGNMPGFESQLEEEEILLIVRYEREAFGAEDPAEACKITLEIDPASCDG